MTKRSPTTDVRHGFTLLEMMVALTISATLMASSMMILRSSYAAWQIHEADLNCAATGNAMLRCIVQAIRQADSIVAPDPPSDSTSLTILRANGETLRWFLIEESVVQEGTDSNGLVAAGITDLSFTAYLADGVTLASTADEAQSILCEVTTNKPSGGTRTVSSFVWVRSW